MITLDYLKYVKNRKYLNQFKGKFIVYKITNVINNKCYIGITTRIKSRVKEHINHSLNKSYLHKAISKYGLECFSFEILDFSNSLSELNDKEIIYINYFNSNNINFGYNLTSGGNVSNVSYQVILKKRNSSRKIKIAKYDLQGNILETYISVKEASRQNNVSDSDLHRCDKNRWSRNGFMYRKYTDEAEKKIEPYISRVGNNLKIKGRISHNAIKCQLYNKQNQRVEFEAKSIKELSEKCGLHKNTLLKLIKNESHKKWKLIKVKQ